MNRNREASINLNDDDADNQNIFLALVNVLFGIGSVLFTLISLSVVPDCIGQIRTQFLTFSVTQIVLHLTLLIVATIYVTYLLAANSKGFMEESLNDFAGYYAIFCLSTSAVLQLFSSIQRYLSVIWPGLYARICNIKVSFLIILGAFLFGANSFVEHFAKDRTINYNLSSLRWLFNAPYQNNVNVFAIIACSILVLLSVVSIVQIKLRIFPTKSTSNRLDNIKQQILTVILYLLTDLTFFLLLNYCNYKALPGITSKFRYINFIKRNYYDGFLQTYLLLILPTINAIINYDLLRKALCFRGTLMLGGVKNASAYPNLPHNGHDSNGKYAIPVFKFQAKLATSTTAIPQHSIVNNLRGSNRSGPDTVE